VFGVSISSLCGFFIIVTDQSIRSSIRSKAGIGLQTRRALAEGDATVIVPTRTPDKAHQALDGIPTEKAIPWSRKGKSWPH
jgi:hypothetical protein